MSFSHTPPSINSLTALKWYFAQKSFCTNSMHICILLMIIITHYVQQSTLINCKFSSVYHVLQVTIFNCLKTDCNTLLNKSSSRKHQFKNRVTNKIPPLTKAKCYDKPALLYRLIIKMPEAVTLPAFERAFD